MRVVIQRVSSASVKVEEEITGSIGKGLLILAGFEELDTVEDVEWMVGKVSRLRIFDDADGVMNLSVVDVAAEILVVSQFTLHAKTKKGNRPSYIMAARPETAIPLYESFIEKLSMEIKKNVPSGIFGAMMEVSLVNDGPVTIIIDTKSKE
ncbi:MAG TPA: D-aminoacyl-tRNA deacylase [Tenuifilaceae bacterium]|nr:D-aminoacyl-tRNA deacylase [Tenuifilaceae bacterium]HPE17006.1 D-aminoacyl-tRNA deacylase [Tenuifilaceae bacterium]HPJ44708.1 D-aminoacyl-tRNA deacylase [Tenuifilaceae bacterium]HPQ32973.1 D-aminoacyl-tRNA deacylase [Tenuifilaceae bacterium]HRX66791.1 D-aminoacyl-tRNA deacylase [Tenuifilaceae bacterium]